MQTTRLSSKGQVVLPKAIRDDHGWAPGTELLIEDGPNGVLLRVGAEQSGDRGRLPA